MKQSKRWLSKLLSLSMLLQALPAFAAPMASHGSVLDSLQQQGPQQTAEYIFRNSPRDNLITVQVFGSVTRPGIYYVPEDTDLTRILTLAGGVVNSGEMSEVVVRKVDGKEWSKIDDRYVDETGPGNYLVNVDKFLKYSARLAPLKLNHDDFVYVPQKEPWISNDAAKIVTLAGVILTGVLTVVLIHHYDNK